MPKKNFAKSIKKTTTIRNAAIKAICQNIFIVFSGVTLSILVIGTLPPSNSLYEFAQNEQKQYKHKHPN